MTTQDDLIRYLDVPEVDNFRQAVALTPADSPDLARRQANLGAVLSVQARLTAIDRRTNDGSRHRVTAG